MTGKTHVVGGNVFALGSYILMKKTGLLVDSVWEPLQLGIILPYATWASTLPDLDQNNKNRVETNPVNAAIQDLFRVIQAGHRSVKSHVAPCIIVGVLCVMSILGKSFFNLNQISTNILFLVLTGLFCGLLSHLILDLCTSDGIVIAGKRIALVPKNPVFGTGTKYESIYRRICYVLSCLLLIMAFVCIGQAAGNIGLLFEEKGYNVLYINTSSEDLALLKNAKHVYHVPNGEGCAKDRDKAKYHLANDIDHLLDLIETKVPQKNVFVVFASGGGTGSGISPYLLNILVEKFSTDEDGELSANPAKLFSAITILPSDSEPLQPAINSYSCCKEILDIENLGTVFFIDNNSMEDKMKINKVFVSELDTVLSIPALHKSVKGNVDKAEIKKVIFETHGMGKILCRPRLIHKFVYHQIHLNIYF